MENLLFWLYLINAIILIIHEIDSAYWKEWELFNLPGGVNSFLLLHFPLLFLVLYGLVLIDRGEFAGLIYSLLLSLAGFAAFSVHVHFLLKGRREFNTPFSMGILWVAQFVSLAQISELLKVWAMYL